MQVLREASRVCKPDGRVVLLEHGLSHYAWLNGQLHSGAQGHHDKWGCWWNRDIADLVRQVGMGFGMQHSTQRGSEWGGQGDSVGGAGRVGAIGHGWLG